MSKRATKRILTFFIACALAVMLCAQGFAQSMTVYTASDNAKVYSAQGVQIGTLQADTALTLTGVRREVCRVELDGKTGYMLKADLKQTAPTQTQTTPDAQTTTETQTTTEKSVTAYVSRDGATVYDADGKSVGTLGLNTVVTVTAMKRGICRVTVSGRTGYMKKTDLSAQKVTQTETTQTQSVTAYAKKDGAKVVNAGGSVITTLSQNDAVTVTGTKGSVCQVSLDGKTGYMKTADLSKEKTKVETKTDDDGVVKVEAAKGFVINDKAKVYDATGKEIGTLSLNAVVSVTAYNDTLVQITTGTTKGYMKKSDISDQPNPDKTNKDYTDGAKNSNGPVGGSTVTPAKGTAVAKKWFDSDIQKIFARGTVAQITDVETGLSWMEKRTGGMYHADCQPLTAADTAALKNAYGGVWSWKRRAVFVTIDGVNYAASINGMPHGGQTITDNDFKGHHCIHFTGSKLHSTGKVDSQHQAAIKKAASTTME